MVEIRHRSGSPIVAEIQVIHYFALNSDQFTFELEITQNSIVPKNLKNNWFICYIYTFVFKLNFELF